MNEMKAINYIKVKVVNNEPSIQLMGECIFETNFLPEQFLKCEIYENKIFITPANDEVMKFFVYRKD